MLNIAVICGQGEVSILIRHEVIGLMGELNLYHILETKFIEGLLFKLAGGLEHQTRLEEIPIFEGEIINIVTDP